MILNVLLTVVGIGVGVGVGGGAHVDASVDVGGAASVGVGVRPRHSVRYSNTVTLSVLVTLPYSMTSIVHGTCRCFGISFVGGVTE